MLQRIVGLTWASCCMWVTSRSLWLGSADITQNGLQCDYPRHVSWSTDSGICHLLGKVRECRKVGALAQWQWKVLLEKGFGPSFLPPTTAAGTKKTASYFELPLEIIFGNHMFVPPFRAEKKACGLELPGAWEQLHVDTSASPSCCGKQTWRYKKMKADKRNEEINEWQDWKQY